MAKKNPRAFLLPFGIGRTIDRVKKVDERGLLYFMDYKANYYKLEKYVDMLATPGCSTFLTQNLDGEKLFCRNYDFSHYRYNKKTEPKDVTGLIIAVRCANKKAKYKSIGIVDGFWLDFNKGRYFEGSLSDGVTNITKIAMAPFVIMDGMNEMGVAVSIMHLPTENKWEEIEYREEDSLTEEEKAIAIIYNNPGEQPKRLDYKVKNNAICLNTADKKAWKANKNLSTHQKEEGKKTTMHPVLMRKMLDFCSNVDECIELAKSVNIMSPLPDNDYHIMIADKSGRSVILEWVDNKLNIVEREFGTNYYLSREDHYGYGEDRDGILENKLSKNKQMSDSDALSLLEEVAQDGANGKFVGFTQWSNIYNLNKLTMDLVVFLDYAHPYKYSIK